MSNAGWYEFSAGVESITLLADAGDFFLLAGGTTPWRLLEVKIWQRALTAITMDSILLHRGTAGAAGGAITEYEYSTAGPAPTVTATSLPTTDVGTDDWQYRDGWNLLQAWHYLPIPKLQPPFKANDDLGITRGTTVAHANVGVQVVWEEYIGS